MNSVMDLDVVIIGGGIAGLWLLARLRGLNYGAILIERQCLGAGQTLCSQGIIHGGSKYALQGRLGGAARAVGQMPSRWRRCLAGSGELDLSGVRMLADHQYLWTSRSLLSHLAGFFASHAMRSRMERVSAEAYPVPLRHPNFQGSVYRLDEPVLDTASLLQTLADRHRDALLLASVTIAPDGAVTLRGPSRETLRLRARRTVLTAGPGNAALSDVAMQSRPLHMVMLRGAALPPFYAHCLGHDDTPRLTVTRHCDRGGRAVWYLGGRLAETGVKLDGERQIQEARRELAELLPWLDLSGTELATLRIDRSEARLPGGGRPDTHGVFQNGPVITAWPTKLALAPLLADEILLRLERDGIRPSGTDLGRFRGWPRPQVASYPWDREELAWS